MSSKYTKLSCFLKYLSEEYNVQICIKDFCGFIPFHKDLDAVLQPYLAHANPYCMYIKSDTTQYHNCLSMLSKTKKKCNLNSTYFLGMCHAGISEYVLPIVAHKQIIGTINIGCFSDNPIKSLKRLQTVCKSSKILDESIATSHFRNTIQSSKGNISSLLSSLELVSEYLSLTYNIIQSENGSLTKKHYNSNEDTILSDALTYLQQNYSHPIYMSDLVAVCHSSESHISHIFKRRIGININPYINKLRVEDAKQQLEGTSSSIHEIAFNIGFSDSNYFSRIFKDLVGISPREYRRRYFLT